MAKADKLLDQVHAHLDPDETVQAWVLGGYETEILGNDSVRSGIMVATERRLVFYAKKLTGFDLESFGYDKVSSFEQGKNMMGPNIKFFASGNRATLKWINQGDVDQFLAVVRERTASGSATPKESPHSDDIPEQSLAQPATRRSGSGGPFGQNTPRAAGPRSHPAIAATTMTAPVVRSGTATNTASDRSRGTGR